MKKILFILVLFVCSGLSAQQYFFNGTVHVPKTTAEINAISSPVEGRQEANSDTGTIYYYNGSDWVDTGKPLVDASGFSGNLDSGITDLQLLAEAVDSLTISGSIADGSITEAKLSTSVNASLDLADSALQSGDNVSELVNDAGYITEGGNLIPVTQAEYDLLTPTEIEENDYAIVDEDDGSGGGIQSVVAGTNIAVDNTDPENPVVSAPDVAVKSSDSGTTGLVLEGSNSGTYTMTSQDWRWSRSGNQVSFTIFFSGIDGSDPVGPLLLNVNSTSFPSMASIGNYYTIFNVIASSFPVNFYSIQGVVSTADTVSFHVSDSLGDNNSKTLTNLDFSGSTTLYISGTYITND